MAIVASSPRSSAARVLVDSATRAWRFKYPTAKVDDCAVVCLYLDSSKSAPVTAKWQVKRHSLNTNQYDIGSRSHRFHFVIVSSG